MRICRRKLDSYIIEAQSGQAAPGALIANAVAAGYKASDIEELEMADQTVFDLLKSQSGPTYKADRAREYPTIGDQLDAILKYLQAQSNLPPELSAILTQWAAVKTKYPAS